MKRTVLVFFIIIFGLISPIQSLRDVQPSMVSGDITPLPARASKSDFSVFTPISTVSKILTQINQERVLADLRKLTGEEPICNTDGCYTISNRLTGSEGLRWAKTYVYEKLLGLGYEIEIEDWSLAGYADQNLIARKPGILLPEEVIYFVAHLDGVNSPAADDNASGAVDILELARVLSRQLFNRTIILLISTGEEQGTLGAQSHINQLTLSELSAIKYVVNVDMVGYDANEDTIMELWHGDHAPSLVLAQMMRDIIQAYQINLAPNLVAGCG